MTPTSAMKCGSVARRGSLLEALKKGDELLNLAWFEAKFWHRWMPGHLRGAQLSSTPATRCIALSGAIAGVGLSLIGV
jgi:hypothetical protein